MILGIVNEKLAREVFRFLVVGFLNLGVMYGVYRIFLVALPYEAAYTLAIIAGMVFSWFVNSLYSFQVKPKTQRLLPHLLVATLFYLAGLVLLEFLVEEWSVPAKYAPLLVIAVLTPSSFFATRVILVWQPRSQSP